jgi:hypothetical protein
MARIDEERIGCSKVFFGQIFSAAKASPCSDRVSGFAAHVGRWNICSERFLSEAMSK